LRHHGGQNPPTHTLAVSHNVGAAVANLCTPVKRSPRRGRKYAGLEGQAPFMAPLPARRPLSQRPLLLGTCIRVSDAFDATNAFFTLHPTRLSHYQRTCNGFSSTTGTLQGSNGISPPPPPCRAGVPGRKYSGPARFLSGFLEWPIRRIGQAASVNALPSQTEK
jgi:hypothetical protein